MSIDDHKIRSYEDVIKLNDRLEARRASQKLNKLWANKISSLDTSSDLGNNYHYFKDLCEPLEECLKIHKSVEGIKSILSKYKIAQPQWHLQNLKKELQIIKAVYANRQKANIESQFENLTLQLKPFENQKNQMAYQMIQCIYNRDCDSYDFFYTKLKDIIMYQESFQKINSMFF